MTASRPSLHISEQRHQQTVADYLMRNPDVSRDEAHTRIREAKNYLGRPLRDQDPDQRTRAITDLGMNDVIADRHGAIYEHF